MHLETNKNKEENCPQVSSQASIGCQGSLMLSELQNSSAPFAALAF